MNELLDLKFDPTDSKFDELDVFVKKLIRVVNLCFATRIDEAKQLYKEDKTRVPL